MYIANEASIILRLLCMSMPVDIYKIRVLWLLMAWISASHHLADFTAMKIKMAFQIFVMMISMVMASKTLLALSDLNMLTALLEPIILIFLFLQNSTKDLAPWTMLLLLPMQINVILMLMDFEILLMR